MPSAFGQSFAHIWIVAWIFGCPFFLQSFSFLFQANKMFGAISVSLDYLRLSFSFAEVLLYFSTHSHLPILLSQGFLFLTFKEDTSVTENAWLTNNLPTARFRWMNLSSPRFSEHRLSEWHCAWRWGLKDEWDVFQTLLQALCQHWRKYICTVVWR